MEHRWFAWQFAAARPAYLALSAPFGMSHHNRVPASPLSLVLVLSFKRAASWWSVYVAMIRKCYPEVYGTKLTIAALYSCFLLCRHEVCLGDGNSVSERAAEEYLSILILGVKRGQGLLYIARLSRCPPSSFFTITPSPASLCFTHLAIMYITMPSSSMRPSRAQNLPILENPSSHGTNTYIEDRTTEAHQNYP